MTPEPNNWTPQEVIEYALSFDGYKVFGDRCGEMANKVEKSFRTTGGLPPGLSIDELRNALFFFIRADRHSDGNFEEDPGQVEYVNELFRELLDVAT